MKPKSTVIDWAVENTDDVCKGCVFSISIKKHIPLLMQFLQYLMVGGLAFILDFGTLYFALQANLHYLMATFLGFCVGLTCNFILCITWVWKGTEARTLKDFTTFTLIGLAGLLLTAILMWFLVDILSFLPTWSKAITAGLVLVWNFTLRKLFVFFH